MPSPYNPQNYPDAPDDINAALPFLRELVRSLRQGEVSIHKMANASETVASLQVISTAPERSQDGDEVEVSAALGAVAPFGSGAGKYVMRSSVWVFIG